MTRAKSLTPIATVAATLLVFAMAMATPARADLPVEGSAALEPQNKLATLPDLDAMIDDNPDFDGLEYRVPPNIDRRPAVLPATAVEDDSAFPSSDSD